MPGRQGYFSGLLAFQPNPMVGLSSFPTDGVQNEDRFKNPLFTGTAWEEPAIEVVKGLVQRVHPLGFLHSLTKRTGLL